MRICSATERLSITMSFTTRWMNSTYLRGEEGRGGGEEKTREERREGKGRRKGRRGEEKGDEEERRGERR